MKRIFNISVFFCFVLVVQMSNAQTIDSLPTNQGNTRFDFSEFQSSIIRPSLSINGFTYGSGGATSNFGMGLKEILESRMNDDVEMTSIFNQIFLISEQPIATNISSLSGDKTGEPKFSALSTNSIIIQYTAFEALATYVLENNSISVTEIGLPSNRTHSAAMAKLRSELLYVSNSRYFITQDSDFVKNTRSIKNISRALDLYLAIENAYKKWDLTEYNDENSSILLTKVQREKLNQRFYEEVVYYMHEDLEDAGNFLASLFGVQEYEVEPGNRPLKGFASLGYSTLALQDLPIEYWETQEIEDYEDIYGSGSAVWLYDDIPSLRFNEARDKVGSVSNGNRVKYWGYQTSDGLRQWAEGPYYMEFALLDAIPFWHAVRINGLLGTIPDPFRPTSSPSSKWFSTPLEWLADISTPDGRVPPIDDGNKREIRVANFLRWSDNYGSTTIGKKYTTVYNNILTYQSGYSFGNENYLLDIAIPKRPTTSTLPLDNLTDPAEQLVVLRHTDSNNDIHYLLFVKEYGNSISRGEGHEQPDQMQILYYINNNSYLVDAGYDRSQPEGNSTWNNYYHHNVLHYSTGYIVENGTPSYVKEQNLGGVESPKLPSPLPTPPRKLSSHPSISNFSINQSSSKVVAIEGSIPLAISPLGLVGNYRRRIVEVMDGNPYIIDFNLFDEYGNTNPGLQKMHYWGNSSQLVNQQNIEDWSYWDVANYNPIPNHSTNKNLYIAAISSKPINDTNSCCIGYNQVTADGLYIQEYVTSVVNSYLVKRKVYAHLGSSDQFGLVTFIKASEQSQAPSNSLQEIDLGSNVHAGYHMIDSNTMDLAIARDDASGDLDFEFTTENNQTLRLPDGMDYGFVRLEKQNGLWKIDNDYRINITQPGYLYTNNQTISGTYTYPSGSKIYIGEDATLTFTGAVDINNAKVYLGQDAGFEIDGGTLETNTGAEFKRLNSSDEFDGVFLRDSDGSTITGTKFTGGFFGLLLDNADNTIITDSRFSNNAYGMYLENDSKGPNWIKGGVFENNTYDGLKIYSTSYVKITTGFADPYPENRPKFVNNGNNGIELSLSSTVYVGEASINNNGSHDVRLDIGSRAYFGGYTNTENNIFGATSEPGYYIYNLAKSGSGETQTNWEVPAINNYWNDGTTFSYNTGFYGSVDHTPYLTEDPLCQYDPHCGTGDPLVKTDETPRVLISALVSQSASQGANNPNEQLQIVGAKQKLADLSVMMSENPVNPLNGRWLRTYSDILRNLGPEFLSDERLVNRSNRKKWLASYNVLTSQTADTLADLEQAISFRPELNEDVVRLQERVEAAQKVGEVAVLMEMEDALDNEDYKRVIKLYQKYASSVQNGDNQTEMLLLLSISYQRTGEYGSALAAIEQSERILPDQTMVNLGYEATDYSEVKAMLLDSARAKTQSISFSEVVPGSVEKRDFVPTEFELVSAYPNPFNPTTIIGFDVPQRGKVRIDVFNIAGQLVSVLTNENYSVGRHQVEFRADGLASGVYFVRATYQGKIATQQITLIK